MTQAIEVAKQLAALVSAVVSADFRVYAFDTAAFPIEAAATEGTRPALSEWEAAFKLVKADGCTSIGAPLARMTKEEVYVEQIVLVTDEGENTPPFFRDAWAEYAAALGVAPTVIVVRVGASGHSPFEDGLRQRGIEVLTYEFGGDYYALANVLPFPSMSTRSELVDTIVARDLPQRPRQASHAHGKPSCLECL